MCTGEGVIMKRHCMRLESEEGMMHGCCVRRSSVCWILGSKPILETPRWGSVLPDGPVYCVIQRLLLACFFLCLV